MILNQTFELEFAGKAPAATGAAGLTAEFTWKNENGEEQRLSTGGFYAGDGRYKVRFLPETLGEYSWKVTGKEAGIEESGTENCVPGDGAAHGCVRVNGYGFAHVDGTPYLPFGTTVYALAHQPDSMVDETLATLENSPFNKVRMCVFPKSYEYNHNDPEFYAFGKDADGNWDVSNPCPAFWDRFESILKRLDKLGIQVDLILFHPYDRWGFASLAQKDNLAYLDYLLRRLSAFPNLWWSLANEYDLCKAKTMEDWYEIEAYVAEHDPYHHLLSNHQCFKPWDFSRKYTTHVCVQTKTVSRVAEWRSRFGKPVMVDECCYEGNLPQAWGCLSGKEMTERFWMACATGGYCTHGETFLDEETEVVWWAKGGKLRGESPARIAFLRKVMEELPGTLEPVRSPMEAALTMEGRKQMEKQLAGVPAEHRAFAEAILSTEPRELEFIFRNEMDYCGKTADDRAFLNYYWRHCYSRATLRLPEDKTYRIEVIDTWAMTREIAAENASGSYTVALPGKEGMAVLAVAEG